MNQDEPITKLEFCVFILVVVVVILHFWPIHLPLMAIFTNGLVLNVIGGIIVAFLTWITVQAIHHYYGYRFKKVFGEDVNQEFFIVYGLLELNPVFDANGYQVKYPFIKRNSTYSFGYITPTSEGQLRGVKYISELIGKNLRVFPSIKTDEELMSNLDISYCSVGGLNNLKTVEIIDSENNSFFRFNEKVTKIIGKNNSNLEFSIDQINNFDFGFIIKIKPNYLGNRTWIGIAGLGEWGTSGAAWYLSRNWKEIEKKYKGRPFGLIVKVKGHQDESAQLVYQS